jgi:predicted transcriptional regulator
VVGGGGGNGSRRRARGELESAVLAALWSADGPVPATAVQREIGADIAYTTVLTILTRLCAKGLVRRRRAGRAHLYAPMRSEAEQAAAGMHTLLAEGGDRAAVLARFVSDLSAADEALLEQLLADSHEDPNDSGDAGDPGEKPGGAGQPQP